MTLDKKKILKNLIKKGFTDNTNRSVDHKYLEYHHNGKLIAYTKLSHGSKKEIDNYLIIQMAKQCQISKNDFVDLVNCPLSAEKYLEKLIENGITK
ncbi:hypothetical protein [Flavobacterium sp.]|jgi:hypothetical protein|uniref:hypothetical protein n=1 Tax=Flavobacterium sp. TaxID=239 RepID=UPI002A81DAD2|nr:hypothetical protein [Flavobacterium sp.]